MDFTTIISNIGFPIACCIAMGKFIYDTSNNNNENQKQFKEKQLKEMEKQTALQQTTLTEFQSIADSLKKISTSKTEE